jgi:hypothetical protein
VGIILETLDPPDYTPGRLYIDGMANQLVWVDYMGMLHYLQEGA